MRSRKLKENVQYEKPKAFENLRKNIEYQDDLAQYDEEQLDLTFNEYLEMGVLFGYVTLFAISFPLIPLMAWVSNILEIEVDRFKLVRLYKRPMPQGAADIGNFYNIFDFLSMIAIFSNVGILVFTSNSYAQFSETEKWIFFTGLTFFYVVIKMAIISLVPDIPEKTVEIRNRHKYITEKIFNITNSKKKDDIFKQRQVHLEIITK